MLGWFLWKIPSFEIEDKNRGTPMTKRKPPFSKNIEGYILGESIVMESNLDRFFF